MKTRFPSILGVFAAILMVASFVVPMNIAAPSAVSADPGIMKWDTVITPGAFPGKNDILNPHWNGTAATGTPYGSEIIDFAIGNDGITYPFIVKTLVPDLIGALPPPVQPYINMFALSETMGIAAGFSKELSLKRATAFVIDTGVPNPADPTENLEFPSNLYQSP